MGHGVSRRLECLGFVLMLMAPAALPAAGFKVFVIAGTSGDHSPTSNAGKPVIEALALAGGYEITYTTDKTLLNDANLEKYQVFLQLNLYPFDFSNAQRASLQKFVEQGKGWVGIHAAGCAQSSWPWYSDFLGGVTFVGHAALRTGDLQFEDRNHPVTSKMPAVLNIRDEWYVFNKSPRAMVRVLAKANPAVYGDQLDHPMVWTNEAFKKMIYISIGHDPADWKVPTYVDLVRDALAWAGEAPTRIGILRPMPKRRPSLALSDAAGRSILPLQGASPMAGDDFPAAAGVYFPWAGSDALGHSPAP